MHLGSKIQTEHLVPTTYIIHQQMGLNLSFPRLEALWYLILGSQTQIMKRPETGCYNFLQFSLNFILEIISYYL